MRNLEVTSEGLRVHFRETTTLLSNMKSFLIRARSQWLSFRIRRLSLQEGNSSWQEAAANQQECFQISIIGLWLKTLLLKT